MHLSQMTESIGRLPDILIILLSVIPAITLAGIVVWSDAKKSRASNEGNLNLVLRAERAEKEVLAVKEWARINNHGITPSIPALLNEDEAPARFRIYKLPNPFSFDLTSGWFLIKVDTHEGRTMESTDWEGDELVVKRMERAEQRCRELERKLHSRGREWVPRYLKG